MNDIEKLKQILSNIPDIVTNLKKESTTSFCGPCPICGGNDRFVYRTDSERFWCRQCNEKGGDIVDFHVWIEGIDTKGLIKKYILDDSKISKPVKSKIIERYQYRDEKNKLLFEVCRYEPKDFRQRQPKNPGWVYNMKGVRRVLYRLPEVLQADEIIICEGEADTDNLYKIGFTATTCAMGAGKWRPEYNDAFENKNVVLLPDNDDQGREHMAKVGASLKGIAKSIKWIELPDLPEKGDVSDYIERFKDKVEAAERLSVLIDSAGLYEPPKKATIEDAILEIGQFCELDLPKRQEYLSPWIKEGSINLISGWRGAGKTWFAMGILDAISKGESFGPWQCKESVPCLLLDGEMPREDIIERSNDLRITSARKNPFLIYSDAHANRLGLPRAHLANDKWRQDMKQFLITRNIKLWVTDNLSSLASGLDENTKKDWDPINSWLLELRFAGISTIMLHHTGKDGNQRGISSREDNIDTSIILKAPRGYTPEDGARFIVHFTKSRVKMSDLHLVADSEFKLIYDENKNLVWSYGNVKAEIKNEILILLDQGLSQTDVKDTLEIHKATVSKIRSQAIKDGLLTPKNKLTPSGFEAVN